MVSLCIETPEGRQRINFENYATIGRSSRCTLCVNDIKLSRVHCEIIKEGDDYILIDLHSQNGTNLNEKLTLEAILKDGDILTLGKSEIVFYLEDVTDKQEPQLPQPPPIPKKNRNK